MRYSQVSLAALTALTMGAVPFQYADAQDCTRDAMLVFDGSASMLDVGHGSRTPARIEEARKAVGRVVPEVEDIRKMGLLIYGPGTGDVCGGIDLRFGPSPNAADQMMREIADFEPDGLTPIEASVRAAAETLNYRELPGIVVVVTDGSETCQGNPCALGHELARDAYDLTVHVIGFRLVYDPFSWSGVNAWRSATNQVTCLAEATGGLFVETDTVDELTAALRQTLGCGFVG